MGFTHFTRVLPIKPALSGFLPIFLAGKANNSGKPRLSCLPPALSLAEFFIGVWAEGGSFGSRKCIDTGTLQYVTLGGGARSYYTPASTVWLSV